MASKIQHKCACLQPNLHIILLIIVYFAIIVKMYRSAMLAVFTYANELGLEPGPLIGSFQYVKRFRNLKFNVKWTANIQNSVLSSSGGTIATCHASKQSLISSQLAKFNKQSAGILSLKIG